MECPECSWYPVFVGILFAAIITGVSLYLIRYPLRPTIEKHFQDNSKVIRKKIIIALINSHYWMLRLCEELEKIKGFDSSNNKSYTITPMQFDQIKSNKERINELWKKIQILHSSPNDISFDDYLSIQKYVTASYSIVELTSNRPNDIFLNAKAVKFVWYHAKIILTQFNKKELGRFYDDWKSDFDSIGGMDKIEYPKLEPGDVLSTHHNLDDELFYYDAKFTGIMTGFREMMVEFGEIKKILKTVTKKPFTTK